MQDARKYGGKAYVLVPLSVHKHGVSLEAVDAYQDILRQGKIQRKGWTVPVLTTFPKSTHARNLYCSFIARLRLLINHIISRNYTAMVFNIATLPHSHIAKSHAGIHFPTMIDIPLFYVNLRSVHFIIPKHTNINKPFVD